MRGADPGLIRGREFECELPGSVMDRGDLNDSKFGQEVDEHPNVTPAFDRLEMGLPAPSAVLTAPLVLSPVLI
ncbi:hypothetical protein ACYOEI_25010 [Singulisphaera rosea]